MSVFELQPGKLTDLAKEVVGLHFDSLNDAVSKHNNRNSLVAKQLPQNLAEFIGVVELRGHIIRPSSTAIATLFGLSAADSCHDLRELTHLQRSGAELRISHRLPE